MPTPHIESNPNDIASIVIMPGDPNRAKYIADNYLENVKLINQIRGMDAYTGYYQNKKITVFPSGMGIPSIGIYAYELFNNYNVDYIIRIGTMGAYDPNLKLGDVILADCAYSDSSFANVQSDYQKNYLYSSEKINDNIIKTAKENKIGIWSNSSENIETSKYIIILLFIFVICLFSASSRNKVKRKVKNKIKKELKKAYKNL